MFYFDKISDKKVLKSDLIQDVEAFFTTKNCCIFTKDNTVAENETISQNRKTLANIFDIKEENFITCNQTHGKNIEIANPGGIYPDCDALILTEKNMGIFLNFADCTPIILYDKVNKIGAVSHAGWRGTAQKIAQLTAQKMIDEFCTKPQNITALIGPCIGQCCFDVGEDVAQKLIQTVQNGKDFCIPQRGKTFVDLKGINKTQLKEIGIKEIDVCSYCTVCDNQHFYSYRKENKTPLRHSAVLVLS